MILTIVGRQGTCLVTQVDELDAARVTQHCWHRDTQGYASGYIDGRLVAMHRFILGLPRGVGGRGQPVDHINGDKLDNRRSNLRVGYHINRLNCRANKRSRTGITGVGQNKDGKWFANWKTNGRRKFYFFDSMEEAVACRMDFNRFMNLPNAMVKCA